MTPTNRADDTSSIPVRYDLQTASDWLRRNPGLLQPEHVVGLLGLMPAAIVYDAIAANDPTYAARRAHVLGAHEQQRERAAEPPAGPRRGRPDKRHGLPNSIQITAPSFDSSVDAVLRADRARRAEYATRLRDPDTALDAALQTRAEKLIDRQHALAPEQRADDGWARFAGDRAFTALYDAQIRPRDSRTRFQASEMKFMGAAACSGVALVSLVFFNASAVLWSIIGGLFLVTAVAAWLAGRSNKTAAIEEARNDLVWIEAIRRSIEHQYADRVKDNELKRHLAERRANEALTPEPVPEAAHAPTPVSSGSDGARAQRKATAAEVHEAYAHLQQEWGAYTLDREAFILTKPMLRVRAMPETRAYQDAMTALGDALDELSPDAPQHQIDAAAALAERAWQTWHAANDAAEALGVDDCTATERAALDRLSKLVERIAHPSTPAIERANIVRDIERCMKLITTAPVAWSDLRVLPELAETLPALPAPAPPVATTGHQTVGEERSESLTEPSFTNSATS
ncbi:hypothetical protein [Tsukamurella spumae]|uniref:Uncharacterized protein n=1 Tax=Tsukamurella spumae TaxID=44753 RepID=A0A846X2D8_9ACTN|nr:hypothetical protein [Tsukamurella spumae]NKY19474.1 hypothetical protein [Tsukamurella spumae]